MMSESVGTIYAEIRLALDKLQKDTRDVTATFKRIEGKAKETSEESTSKFDIMGKNVGKALDGMSNTGISKFTKMLTGMQKAVKAVPIVGAILLIVGAAKKLFSSITSFVNDATNAWIRHHQEIAKIDTILNTSGAAAWTTTRQLRDMAMEVADASGRSADEVMRLQSVLLGFRSVTGEAFERTTRLAADMAAVMGGDLVNAGKNLGRALEDPIQGMRLLARYGFVFDSATKANIQSLTEQGKVLEAQGIILDNIEGAFGGVAAAINNVNEAQSRLDSANERIAIAAGEATRGWTLFWRTQRARIREARADFLELRNDIARAERADYSQHIAQIERLRKSVANAADEIERVMPEHLLVMAELELNREKFTDELVIAERDLRRINRAIALNSGMATRAQEAERQRLVELIASRREYLGTIDEEIQVRQQWAADRQAQLAQEEADTEKVNELAERLLEIESRRVDTLREIERAHRAGMITQDELQVRTMAAYQAEANSINQLMSMSARLNLSTAAGIRQQEELMANLSNGLNQAAGEYNRLGEEIRVATERLTSAQLVEFINVQTKVMNRAFRTLESNRAMDLIDEEEYLQRRLQIQSQFWRTVDNFAAQHGVDWRQNQATFNTMIRDVIGNVEELEARIAAYAEAQRLYDFNIQAHQRLNLVLQDLGDEYIRQTGTIEQVRDMERRRAWEAIAGTEHYIFLLEKANEGNREAIDLLAEIEASFDRLWNTSENRNPWDNFLSGIQLYGQQVMGVLNAGMRLHANNVRRETEILRRELEQRHRLLRQGLERDLQARLHYMGFVDAATELQHKKELQLAIESGDQQRIFLAHSNLERFRVEEEFALKKQELDEDVAREKAKLEFRAAMASWRGQVVSAMASAAQAVLSGFATQPFIPAGLAAGSLAASLGAMQVSMVRSNKPKLQSFARGGIVGGNQFRGDMNLVRADTDEMFLNRRQQRNMFNAIDRGEIGGDVNVTIPISLDGSVIAEFTVDAINRRKYFISKESVV
jgi:arsenate reductase-like glutaredoxin family protein